MGGGEDELVLDWRCICAEDLVWDYGLDGGGIDGWTIACRIAAYGGNTLEDVEMECKNRIVCMGETSSD
jgi:hypothetical protein